MKTVVIGLVGTSLDNRGVHEKRWNRWRPTLSLCQHEDLLVNRLELLFQARYQALAEQIRGDLAVVSPKTTVVFHPVEFEDPWDFEQVYAALHDFARGYLFDLEREKYLIHITTGTHVAQICLYLLTEAHYLQGRLVQTSPSRCPPQNTAGHYQIIDLDLSKYDRIASRFSREHREGTVYLKSGIATRNAQFNQTIEQLEQVSIRSQEAILLTGPTGVGKSMLARRVFELKKRRGQMNGSLVEVNCATLRGDHALSTLFGHVKGAFTGATQDRKGLLTEAHGGMLFLDEIGELGLDEQAMLLRAIEDKRFMPLGADRDSHSDFQLIAGTNRNLYQQVQQGAFREDLLARINLWSYPLPSLKQRIEDLEPNLHYELDCFARKAGTLVSFNKDAKACYLDFAHSDRALWRANFRDLNASITRMATLAPGGRITLNQVRDEIIRLERIWQQAPVSHTKTGYTADVYLQGRAIDLFDRIQLSHVIEICQASKSAAEAGRTLYPVSRQYKTSRNDSHRLSQYLKKFGLDFEQVRASPSQPGDLS